MTAPAHPVLAHPALAHPVLAPSPACGSRIPSARVPAEQPAAVAEALQSVRAEDLVAELQGLLAVPSVTGSAAESEAQHRLERRLRSAGMDTDLWSIDVDATAGHPDFPGMEAPRTEAWGLVGACGGSDGPTLVLNGHIDVVPPATPAGQPAPGRVRSAATGSSAAAPAT